MNLKKLAMTACAVVFALAARAVEVTTTDQLIFPGVTLDELGGLKCTVTGGYLPGGAEGTGYFAERVGDTQEVQMQAIDGAVKVAIIKLTEKADGIYAQGVEAKHADSLARLGTDINDNPSGTHGYGNYKAVDLVRTPEKKLLGASSDVKGSPVLLWRNQNLLQLSDFRAYSAGDSWCPAGAFTVCNVVRGETNVTAQFQMQDGTSVKGVVFEFTQGDDGVYGHSVRAYSLGNSTVGECDVTKGSGYSADTYYFPRYIGATVYPRVDLTVTGDSYCFDTSLEPQVISVHGTADATFTIGENVELKGVTLDFSLFEGIVTLASDPKDVQAVVAGADLRLGGDYTDTQFVVPAGAKLTVSSPAAADAMKISRVGTIRYTADLGEVKNGDNLVKDTEGTEYAGAVQYSGAYENSVDMIFSGTAKIAKGTHFRGLTGTFVVADGTTTIEGETPLSHASGTQGAKIRQTGGLVTAGDDGYFYYGGYTGTISIDCLGGRWEAPINPHTGWIHLYDVTIRVGEGAVFAPKNLMYSEEKLTSPYASNSRIVLEDGAIFEVPAQIGNWVKIFGNGTILVKSGVAFDYSSCDMSAFNGTVVVEEGGETKGIYTGNENFYSDRTAIPEDRAWLGGTHKYGIMTKSADAFKGITFCGHITLENKGADSNFPLFTVESAPLNVVGGVFDGGNAQLQLCHEQNAKTYAINLAGDGELTNVRLRWGWYHKSRTTMTMEDTSTFTGSLTPMKNGSMMPDSFFTVNVNDAATFAPKALCPEDGVFTDMVSGPCFVNLNSAEATYVLPEVVPFWVTNTLAAGTLTLPERRSSKILGDVAVEGPVVVAVPAGAENLTVNFSGPGATVVSPVKLTKVQFVGEDDQWVRLTESEADGKFVYHVSRKGFLLMFM